MNFKTLASATKLRGGYYTPAPIARFLNTWIAHGNPTSILEPSCGDGAFLKTMQGLYHHPVSFTGIEWLEEEAAKAKEAAPSVHPVNANIHTADFLEWALEQLEQGRTNQFDAVAGNPPYIRYQYLDAEDQHFAERIFQRNDLVFTKHTNAWVPFVIASLELLAPNGRLAMVIPSEIFHVLHATSLRKFLLAKCSRIFIIDPTALLFEEALQGTVLLMVEKKANAGDASKGVAVFSAGNNDFLQQHPEHIFQHAQYVDGDILDGKWMKVFLTAEEINVFGRVARLPAVHRFKNIANVDVGIVTGANRFFLVDQQTADTYELNDFTHPMFGRSEHCEGIIYDQQMHALNRAKGYPTQFIHFGNTPEDKLPAKAIAYLREGEKQNLHTRYKCSIRTPWYSIPSVYATSVGMLKRCHHYPRLILNSIQAYTTDTAYRIKTIQPGITDELFVFSFINSLTALTAELEGRHYGGGVLELVPSEIEKLLIPIPPLKQFSIRQLDEKIRGNMDVDLLLTEQDQVVLTGAGFTEYDRLVIHNAWRRIRHRRQRLTGYTEPPGFA